MYKAVLYKKLKGTQCSELANPVCPAYDFYEKAKIF